MQKEIDFLFSAGNSFRVFPLRVIYTKQEAIENKGISILISVPKKKIKCAVHRNRLKRLIREAYRLNKQILTGEEPTQTGRRLVAFLFIGNEIVSYKGIETALIKGLTQLQEKL